MPSAAGTPFTLIYWIKGKVLDAPGQAADGRKIYFGNDKAWDVIGPDGNSGRPGEFIINAGKAGVDLDPGMRYRLFTEKSAGYGVGPVEIEITGNGCEDAGTLQLEAGRGLETLRTFAAKEQTPDIKVWFDERLYQKKLVEAGEEFYVPKKPKIRLVVTIEPPYALSASLDHYSLAVDGRTLAFAGKKLGATSSEFVLSLAEELAPGKHVFSINAQSSGAQATAAIVTETVAVTVAGGPLRLLDNPLTYPSPFRPESDREVTLQYTLSDNADIDIFIFNIAGEVVKKITARAGDEGGLGQLNKLKWDGKTDTGITASSGVYVGNIVAREEKKVLGKFKLTVYR
jgi:hypothetical protein